MKVLVSIAFFILLLSNNLFSQDYSNGTENFLMGIGPALGYKIGINTVSPPEGYKNDIAVSNLIDIGAQGYIPFNPDSKMGLIVDLAYSSYAYKTKIHNTDENTTYNYKYLTLGGNFYLSGFTVGLNIGIPMSGSRDDGSNDLVIESSNINTMFELRLGGNFSLSESPTGRFILFINGGYQLNSLFIDEFDSSTYNPHIASVQFGLSYLFNVGQDYED